MTKERFFDTLQGVIGVFTPPFPEPSFRTSNISIGKIKILNIINHIMHYYRYESRDCV